MNAIKKVIETVSKAYAQYEPKASMPEHRCSGCEYWLGRGTCRKVRGEIRAGGWCKFWKKG